MANMEEFLADALPEIDFSKAVRREPYRGKGMILMRWVETPDGRLEQMDLRLTPELFLHQTYEDRICYCTRHNDAVLEIASLLRHHFSATPDVTVFRDMLHLLGPGLPTPGPDVSVVRGLPELKRERFSLDVEKDGVRPCLIVEVVSPDDPLIRRADLEDKVEVYKRAGVQEHVIVDWTLRNFRFRLIGYRLDSSGRYQPIQPDAEGRVLSETTGIWFQVSPDGERVYLFEYPTGRRLLNLEEQEERANREANARKAAERKALRETEARKAAEAEVERLRSELERLRGR